MDRTVNRVCFFHRADLDGKCAGEIVRRACKGEIEMIGINYGDDYEKVVFENVDADTEVVMVDFCMQPWNLMVRLKETVKRLLWIDHHAEAIKSYEGWLNNPFKAIEGYQREGEAGCELTWKWFHPSDEMPKAVYLLGRYDVWAWKDVPDALEFQMGMRIEENWPGKADELWDKLLRAGPASTNETLVKVIEQGRTILRYKTQQDAIHVRSAAFNLQWRGKIWVAINEMFNNSQLFDAVYDPVRHHGMLTFGWRHGQWNFSLYTTRDDVNVGEIATAVGKELGTGGGGHPRAAGFQAKELPFDLVKDKLEWIKDE